MLSYPLELHVDIKYTKRYNIKASIKFLFLDVIQSLVFIFSLFSTLAEKTNFSFFFFFLFTLFFVFLPYSLFVHVSSSVSSLSRPSVSHEENPLQPGYNLNFIVQIFSPFFIYHYVCVKPFHGC